MRAISSMIRKMEMERFCCLMAKNSQAFGARITFRGKELLLRPKANKLRADGATTLLYKFTGQNLWKMILIFLEFSELAYYRVLLIP